MSKPSKVRWEAEANSRSQHWIPSIWFMLKSTVILGHERVSDPTTVVIRQEPERAGSDKHRNSHLHANIFRLLSRGKMSPHVSLWAWIFFMHVGPSHVCKASISDEPATIRTHWYCLLGKYRSNVTHQWKTLNVGFLLLKTTPLHRDHPSLMHRLCQTRKEA